MLLIAGPASAQSPADEAVMIGALKKPGTVDFDRIVEGGIRSTSRNKNPAEAGFLRLRLDFSW